MSDFFNPYKKSKKKIDVNKNQINNLGFFSITDSGKDSTIEYKRNEKEVEDYDYEENEDFSKKSDLGFAFKLGLLDTYRGVKQIAGFDESDMRREQAELIKRMQGENGGLVKAAYFAGALLDPASWLIPFGKARTLWQMGKYGMVSGAVAGAAGYVDEDQDSILTEGKMTRKEQALFGLGAGGVVAPAFGVLKNIGVKATGKGTTIPVGGPDPEGFFGQLFSLKHVDPKKAVKRGYTKTQLQGAAKTAEPKVTPGGRKVIVERGPKRTVFERQDERIGDPTADIKPTVVKDDLELLNKNKARKGMFLFGPQSFANKYIFKPYEEKIGRPTFSKLSKSGEATSAVAGGLYGFNMDEELPIMSFTDPFSSRLGRAFTGAVFGFGGFKLLKKTTIPRKFGKGTAEEQGKEFHMSLTEFLGRGFIDKYNLPREYTALRQQAQGLGGMIASQFNELVQKAKILTVDERKILYNILEGEDIVNVKSKKIKELSEEARKTINMYGQMYHDLGLLDKKVFRKNAASYLQRIYADKTDVPRIGDDLRPRGIIKNVSIDEYLKTFKNQKAFNEDGTRVMVRGGLDDRLPNGKIPMIPHRGWEVLENIDAKKLNNKKYVEELKARNLVNEDGEISIRWELTKGERLAKGEIEDAAASIELTGQYMASTISQFKFYDDLFKMPELSPYVKKTTRAGDKYVLDKKFKGLSDSEMNKAGYYKMPNTKFPDSKVKKYGKLSGKYVQEEIYKNLLAAQKYRESKLTDYFGDYLKLNRVWKASKTAWNPTVHVNNVFGNIFFSDMGDIPLFVGTGKGGGLINSFKLLAEHNSKKPIKSKVVYLAQKYGVFDADFITRELKTFDFKSIKNAYKYDDKKTEWANAVEISNRIYNAVRKNKITGTLENWYRLEDHIFRLNAFIHKRQQGFSDADAAMFARKQFIDYDIQAPVINFFRHGVTPFLAFSYRVIPLLAETAVVRPWKYAKYAALGYGLSKVGGMMGGGDAEKERQLMPKTSAGNILGIPILPTKEIKLPFTDKEGNSKYINIERLFPGGDILELGQGIIPGLPAPFQPSFGIAGDVVFGLAGVDLFTKKMDQTRGISVAEDITGSLKSIGVKLIPNFPFLPGSYSTKRIERAQPGRTEISPFREPESELQAILNAFGIKVTNRSLTSLTVTKKAELDKILKKYDLDIKNAGKKLASGEITEKQFEEEVADIVIKIQKQVMIFGGRLEGIDPATILQSKEMIDLMNSR